MNAYQRETLEFQPVTITLDGTEVTTGVELAVHLVGERPADWEAPTTLDGQIGYLIDAPTLEAGLTYVVWYRVTDSPEIPVGIAGRFRIV